jgi:hypothetical protein
MKFVSSVTRAQAPRTFNDADNTMAIWQTGRDYFFLLRPGRDRPLYGGRYDRFDPCVERAGVLAIDWDLRKPTLHKYFGPFLGKKSSRGPIDYLWD